MKKAITRRRVMELTAAFAASSAVAHNVQAQAYPNRTIRLIAPFPAGGGTDSAARIIAARLSELLGQQVVVDNRPGAGSNIGAEAAARSAPDGYTLLLGALALAINRFLYASLNYDSVTDLAPVSLLCRFPNILAVPMSSLLTSVSTFIDYAKANPGKVTYSSPGIPVNCLSAWPASSSSTCPIAAPGPVPLPTPSPAASTRLSTLPAPCSKPCAPGNCAGSPSPR
jgi:tripartite-type tricarboxylate transporter receptor subunit TctC